MGRRISFMFTSIAAARKLQFMGLLRRHDNWPPPNQDKWLSDGLIEWCAMCEWERERESKTDPTIFYITQSHQFSSVQLPNHVRLFATPWTAAHQTSLSITNSWSLLKLTSIGSVMPSNHLVLCSPLLLPPSIFPSIRVLQWICSLHQVFSLGSTIEIYKP